MMLSQRESVGSVRRARLDELKAVGQLPTPTGVALAILRLVDSDRASVAEITKVLEGDPAMAGRILKLANSASRVGSRNVTSVRDAVSRLGGRAVRHTALCFSVISQSYNRSCLPFDYPRYWSHSLATGVAAQACSPHAGRVAPDEAFTCGLLCQIGKLALASIYPQEYGRILDAARGGPASLLVDLEREHLAIDHNELSAALLADWGLPEAWSEAAGAYETHDARVPDATPTPGLGLARLLCVAVQMAEVCVVEDRGKPAALAELVTRAAMLDIAAAEVHALGDRVAVGWREWGHLLDIAAPAVPPFAQVAERVEAAAKVIEAPPSLPETPLVVTATPETKIAECQPPEPHREGQVAELTILVVSDDPVERRRLADYLAAAGNKVHTAESSRQALRQVFEVSPHLVVTEWSLPEMDGLALCKALRQTQLGQEVYIVMLTARDDEDSLIQALDSGADDYLVKPIRHRALLARIRSGRRVIQLQQAIHRDKELLRNYAAELEVANRKLQQDALTDALTGLPNRRYAMKRLDEEWAASSRTRRPLTVMIVDIDRFKAINDTHGHDIGDLVIREAAGVLHQVVRRSDSVCRLGGEEFLILCPGTDLGAGGVCAERVRAAVAETTMRTADFEGKVTISVGVAVRTPDMRQIADLLKAADLAVYAAKREGRNRVCFSGE